MIVSAPSRGYICTRCLRKSLRSGPSPTQNARRTISRTTPQRQGKVEDGEKEGNKQEETVKEQGAMTKRLEDMTEESLGSRAGRKAFEEASFNEDLVARLEDRIKDASFRSENAQAFAAANLPKSAGQGTKDVASARPWSGSEAAEDAALRMLDDSIKPIKVPRRSGTTLQMPKNVDTGRPKNRPTTGGRLASARDRASAYDVLKDPSMSEKEREALRKQLKERFKPGARAVPGTIQGLASLANERIEDAIARGQFKNLPRGSKIERDYTASSPFIDTTEYFMNKIIQRQEIVPPWIEKQQELVSTATRFRGRLRADWKRHVARSIASKGGPLERQIELAESYAAAEERVNPRAVKVETINSVSPTGHMSQITLSGELKVPKDAQSNREITQSDDKVEQITITETSLDDGMASNGKPRQTPVPPAAEQDVTIRAAPPPPRPDALVTQQEEQAPQQQPAPPAASAQQRPPIIPPFRDESYLATERSYQSLAIEELNSLTRSYNLMAPNLAKKPYFNLERELRSCYADVAPLVADEIRERARRPKLKVEMLGKGKEGGVLERLGGGASRVHDERRPQYGFRELWRDLFRKE